MKRSLILLTLLSFFGGLSCPGWCGATSGLRITDVTIRSFSLVWLAGKAASCSARVYADAQGQEEITGLTITDESANPPAAQNGVMKVSVSGVTLTPETTYYFQTVTTSDEGTSIEPSTGPLPSVTMEKSSGVVYNDTLVHRILRSDGATPALGALLVVEVEGGDYPVTGWVGENVSAPYAMVNLMNIYSAANHVNLELLGGEAITVESLGGLMGFRRHTGVVPEEIGGIQELSPPPSAGQCTLDNIGPVIDGGQLVPIPGAIINDSTPVIRGVYADQLSAIDPGSVRLKLDGVDMTSQAIVNSTEILYTPLAPLVEGVHSVELFVADEWGYEALPMMWSFTIDLTAKGDVNSDGSIDLADAILTLQVVSGMQPVSLVHRVADVNGDGKIGLEEGLFILQKVSGLRP